MTALLETRAPEATRRLARLAGVAYLAMGVATLFGFFHGPLVQADLDVLARMITGPEARFRIGVASDVIAAALVVPLALLLYELLAPVHRLQSALMALLLLVAMPITFVVALDYVAARALLLGAPWLSALSAAERETLGMLFLRLHQHGVLAVEVFWGLWLLPFGWLVMRSRFIPRVLGGLLIVAGVAYVAHSLATLLLAGQRFPLYERVTMLARAAGEFPIMLWLLVRGADARGAGPGAP